ncbi:MAG: DnaA N-terminal domain-containing protein, partial [Rubrimonas sp.]
MGGDAAAAWGGPEDEHAGAAPERAARTGWERRGLADRGSRRGMGGNDGMDDARFDGCPVAQGWPAVAEALRLSMGPAAHARWIAPLRLTGVEDGVARFAAPSDFVADYVARHYADDVLDALRAAALPVVRVVIAARPREAARDAAAEATPPRDAGMADA